MKKLLSLALALALCLGLTVPALAAGDFSISDEGGILLRYDGSSSNVVVPDGVVSIASLAFSGDNLKSVTIPASVTKIEGGAFSLATGLTSIEVDPANPKYTAVDGILFSRDKTLLVQYPLNKAGSSYTIPAGVTHIGPWAFRDCQNLTSILIPDSVVGIGPYAFDGTPWYEQLGEVSVINHCLLEGPYGATVVIPDGITAIGGSAFHGYSRANRGDGALKSVTIPDSVTEIGETAFYYCDNLTDINIPNNVTTIGERAFMGCSGLTSLTIPNGMRSIERMTFAWYSSLTNITISSNITEIGDSAFYQSGLTSVTIPSSVKTIGEGAFSYCAKLTNVSIPDSLTDISAGMFSSCTSLKNVVIPSSVTSIGGSAFSGCTNLTSVTIPSSVTHIGEHAFHIFKDGDFSPISGLTIHGVAGSYAETYAKENNIPFVADGSAAPSTPAAPASSTKFTDVSASSPFVDAINWAVEKNITTGKTDTTFAPGEECTNGQILTFLWRTNGSPEPTIDNPFTDSIPASFQKAAVWAYEKGLVSGAVFGASTPCTRAVTVEYLWKAAGSPATSGNASFTDVPANADYAQAVAWAVENGVTSGTGNGQFSPANTCTRGQIVTFLYRAMGK